MIDIRVNKIEAIKALRQFTLDTFGLTAGLKLSKDFVEALQAQKDAVELETKLREAENLLLSHGYQVTRNW